MADTSPDLTQLTQIAADVVGAAQRRLPVEIRSLALNVPVHYHSQPGSDMEFDGLPSDILGLFDGDPHGSELAQDNLFPAQILLYVENLWNFAEGEVGVFRDEVRLTYLHELGHYFGWDEDDLTARGLE